MSDLNTKIIDVCIWFVMGFLSYSLFINFFVESTDYVIPILMCLMLLNRNDEQKEVYERPSIISNKNLRRLFGATFIVVGLLFSFYATDHNFKKFFVFYFTGVSFLFVDFLKKKKPN